MWENEVVLVTLEWSIDSDILYLLVAYVMLLLFYDDDALMIR